MTVLIGHISWFKTALSTTVLDPVTPSPRPFLSLIYESPRDYFNYRAPKGWTVDHA